MFVVHGLSKLLTPAGRYVKVEDAKIGTRVISGTGKSVHLTDILKAHVPQRKDGSHAFHNIKNLSWPSKVAVYDHTPILTNYGPLQPSSLQTLPLETSDPPVQGLCPKTINWDIHPINSLFPKPSYMTGYVIGAFYASRRGKEVDESSPILRSSSAEHFERLSVNLQAAFPGNHIIDDGTMHIKIDTKYFHYFEDLEHKEDLPAKYAIHNIDYACGLYMGLNDQMKDSGIVHENIYRAMVLALFLQSPIAQLDDTYLRFPITNVSPKTKRIRVAYVLKVSDPEGGLFVDNTVIMPTRMV